VAINDTYATPEPKRAEVDLLAGPTVLEFGSPWCGYCRAAQPLVASAFTGHPDVRHIRIADARGRPLGRSFNIKLWPTLVFLRNGKETTRLIRPSEASEIANALAKIDISE